MKSLLVSSLLLVTSPSVSQVDSCITPTQRASIVFNNLLSSDTLWFGYHPLGTCGIDSMLCGEVNQWSPLPSGINATWTSLYRLCYPPPRFDYRGYSSPTVVDTHEVSLGSLQWPVYLSWDPALISQLYDSVKLSYTSGSYFQTRWMQRDSSAVLIFPNGFYFQIICYGRSVTSTPSSQGETPNSLVLYQNFPNPFNPTTVIRFQVPSTALVSLTVFDLLGRKVSTLANEPMAPGVHTRTFGSETLPSGVYLCRLSAGSSVKTTKMLFLR
jgi:hypothetical protein